MIDTQVAFADGLCLSEIIDNNCICKVQLSGFSAVLLWISKELV